MNLFPIMTTESLPDFAARYACHRGVRLADFLRHTGIRLDRTKELDRSIRLLANMTGCEFQMLSDRQIRSEGTGKRWINHQLVDARDVARRRVRFCGRCIAEDCNGLEGKPWSRVWRRPSWTHALLSVCPKHRVAFAELPPATSEMDGRDWSNVIRRRWGEVQVLSASQQHCEVPEIDRYFCGRLDYDAVGNEVLDTLTFEMSLALIRVLGAMATGREDGSGFDDSIEARRELCSAGFDIIAVGVQGLSSLLTKYDHENLKSGWSGGYRNLYPLLYDFIYDRSRRTEDDGVLSLRTYIRDHAYRTYPLGPDDTFLGIGGNRTLHSIRTAAVEYGIHPKSIRKLLIANGVIGHDAAHKTDSEIVVDADLMTQLADTWNSSVSAVEVSKRLGVSPQVVSAFASAGLLKSTARNRGEGLNGYFSGRQVEELVGNLTRKAIRDPADPDFVHLKKIRSFTFVELIKMILWGKLSIAIDAGVARPKLGDILVNKSEIDRAAQFAAPDLALNTTQVSNRLRTTATAVRALADLGELASELGPGHRGQSMPYYSTQSVLEFDATFVSLRKVSRRRTEEETTEITMKIKPAFDFGGGALFFRRSDLQRR